MNVFDDPSVAREYDGYYQAGFGQQVDAFEKHIVSDLAAELPRCQVLELGCGTGHWSEFFLQQGFDLVGIDSSDAMLEQARGKNLAADFQAGDAQAIPFPDKSFRMIASITMLEFVEEPDRVFSEIQRVLIPGGWLLLGCLNADSLLARNSEGDPVFAQANFMNPAQLADRLSRLGEPELAFGVHLAEDFSLLDGTPEQVAAEPVFMAGLVQKEK